MSITPLPVPPSTSDPDNFDQRADALYGALPQFVTELNALGSVVSLGSNATSTSSLTIATGDQTLNVGAVKGYWPGMQVVIARTSDPANKQMLGAVKSYDGTNVLVVTVASLVGTGGPYTDWSISAAAVSNNIGKQALWIDAAAILPRNTNGSAPGLVETSTNKVMLRTLDFDANTIEYGQFKITMPKAWNRGTVTFVPIWKHAATTTNFKISWGFQAAAFGDGDALDSTAFGTAVYTNDTGGVTNTLYAGPESAAITIAGSPAAQDTVWGQVLRKADDATNDTLAIDAGLLGIVVNITTNAATDA